MVSRSIIQLIALVGLLSYAVAKPAIPLLKEENELLPRMEDSTDGAVTSDGSAPGKCSNKGLAKKARMEFRNDCDPKFSKGIMSTRECAATGGKTYLCISSKGTIQCHHGEIDLIDLVGGECFY